MQYSLLTLLQFRGLIIKLYNIKLRFFQRSQTTSRIQITYQREAFPTQQDSNLVSAKQLESLPIFLLTIWFLALKYLRSQSSINLVSVTTRALVATRALEVLALGATNSSSIILYTLTLFLLLSQIVTICLLQSSYIFIDYSYFLPRIIEQVARYYLLSIIYTFTPQATLAIVTIKR